MKTKVIIVLMTLLGFFAVTPRVADAGGLILVSCFNGTPPGGLGPNPTAICVMLWGPGGAGQFASFAVTTAAISPPGVIGNTVNSVHNIVSPPTGDVIRQLSIVCASGPVVGTMSALGIGRILSGSMQLPVQVSSGITGGTYPVFCPGGSTGGMSTLT